jgi:hypothetical protein
MFVGHFAVSLAAKKAAPRVSLGTMFIACQLLDLIWPLLVLAGIELVHVDRDATAFTPLAFESYPWSHSLVMSVLWSALAFLLLKLLKRTHLEAVVVATVVFSHWLLDFLTHRPDLPLSLDEGTKVGLGLWNTVGGTLGFELAIFAVGISLYLQQTRAITKKGSWGFWGLIGFLMLIYLVNTFGPTPPPDTPPAAIAAPALAMWLVVAWAYWVDRNREAR